MEARYKCRVQELRRMEQELRQRRLNTGGVDAPEAVVMGTCLVKMYVRDVTLLKAAMTWIFHMSQTSRATRSRVHSSVVVKVCVSTTVGMVAMDAE